MNRFTYIKGWAKIVLTFSLLSLMGGEAFATIITVTGTGDTIAGDGLVTLREAITAANTNAASGDAPAGVAGLDTIRFNIAGAPGTVHTISPLSALPTITEPISIEGYSQLGATANTLAVGSNAFLAIELNGAGAGFVAGLTVNGAGSTIQGLVINRFGNEGILVLAAGVTIQGNFIGTDATGKIDRGNGTSGVTLFSANNLVGGTTLAHRNLISGNGTSGVVVSGASATNNRIINNLIGTDDTGLLALGNSSHGVQIVDAPSNAVGGTLANSANLIAFNLGDGVAVTGATALSNAILSNSIHSNSGLGIDLGNNGVTANDGDDPDAGPNNLQNFPVLTSATTNQLGTEVEGTLNSLASMTFRLEFFANDVADAEGQTYLGFLDVSTNASGDASFTFTSPVELTDDIEISATATDPNNNTSEFSATIDVDVVPPAVFDEDDDDGNDDDGDFDPVPVPVPVPPPPFIPPVADGPIADVPPVAAVHPGVGGPHPAVAVVSDAPKSEIDVKLEGLEETLVPRTSGSDKSLSDKSSKEASGCSTLGKTDGLLYGFLMVMFLWLSIRTRRRNRHLS